MLRLKDRYQKMISWDSKHLTIYKPKEDYEAYPEGKEKICTTEAEIALLWLLASSVQFAIHSFIEPRSENSNIYMHNFLTRRERDRERNPLNRILLNVEYYQIKNGSFFIFLGEKRGIEEKNIFRNKRKEISDNFFMFSVVVVRVNATPLTYLWLLGN